jgi:hypothetical protein
LRTDRISAAAQERFYRDPFLSFDCRVD